jgi:hypothetical protein
MKNILCVFIVTTNLQQEKCFIFQNVIWFNAYLTT